MELRRTARDALIAHARQSAPQECCGLLVGSERRIDEAVPARNIDPSAFRYQIDPVDHFATIRRVRQEGRRIVGAYHSHPAAAPVPSASDVAEAYDAALLYVIVSLRDVENPEVRGYWITEGNFREVPLVTVP